MSQKPAETCPDCGTEYKSGDLNWGLSLLQYNFSSVKTNDATLTDKTSCDTHPNADGNQQQKEADIEGYGTNSQRRNHGSELAQRRVRESVHQRGTHQGRTLRPPITGKDLNPVKDHA